MLKTTTLLYYLVNFIFMFIQVKRKTYEKLHVGDIIRFGQ